MKLLSFLVTAALVASSTAYAAEPTFTSESNQNQRSYRLTLENSANDKMFCSLIEITANLGSRDCAEVIAIYKFTL